MSKTQATPKQPGKLAQVHALRAQAGDGEFLSRAFAIEMAVAEGINPPPLACNIKSGSSVRSLQSWSARRRTDHIPVRLRRCDAFWQGVVFVLLAIVQAYFWFCYWAFRKSQQPWSRSCVVPILGEYWGLCRVAKRMDESVRRRVRAVTLPLIDVVHSHSVTRL